MIWLLKSRVLTELIVVTIMATVSMTVVAQTIEPAIKNTPASAKSAGANSSPTNDENKTDKSASIQKGSPTKPVIPASVEVEIQRRLNELRGELLDDRADNVYWWLVAITIVLGFLAIVSVVVGYMGFGRFREIETDAKTSVDTVTKLAEDAKHYVEEIKANRDRYHEILRRVNAETTADNPEEAKQAVRNVQNNPEASLVDRAIAHAISLQQEGKRDDAIEEWRAIAHVAEGTNNDLAAAAWFSVGYLLQNENLEDAILAYDQAISLKPDLAEAYTNRGNVKVRLERHDDAITDYDEAIRLKPDDDKIYSNRGVSKTELKRYDDAMADHDEGIRRNPNNAMAYNNRGITKAASGRHDDAIVDYDKAIYLKQEFADAYYNRGLAKNALGRKDEARREFEAALEQARKTNNVKIVAQAEQWLRSLDADEGS